MHFGKNLTVLQFSTFVNENIAIMLDSGIDIVVLLRDLFQGGELHPYWQYWGEGPEVYIAPKRGEEEATVERSAAKISRVTLTPRLTRWRLPAYSDW